MADFSRPGLFKTISSGTNADDFGTVTFTEGGIGHLREDENGLSPDLRDNSGHRISVWQRRTRRQLLRLRFPPLGMRLDSDLPKFLVYRLR